MISAMLSGIVTDPVLLAEMAAANLCSSLAASGWLWFGSVILTLMKWPSTGFQCVAHSVSAAGPIGTVTVPKPASFMIWVMPVVTSATVALVLPVMKAVSVA